MSDVVKTIDCERRHRRLMVWMFTAILGSLTFVAILVGWSIVAGYQAGLTGYKAVEAAATAAHIVEVQNAEVAGSLTTIESRLAEIKVRQTENTAELREQRKMIEDLWKSGHGS